MMMMMSGVNTCGAVITGGIRKKLTVHEKYGKKKKEERNKKQFCQHFCWQIVSAGI